MILSFPLSFQEKTGRTVFKANPYHFFSFSPDDNICVYKNCNSLFSQKAFTIKWMDFQSMVKSNGDCFFIIDFFLLGLFPFKYTNQQWKVWASRGFPLLPACSDRTSCSSILLIHCLLPFCTSPSTKQIFYSGKIDRLIDS